MIYRHKASGKMYRHLFTVWNVDTQAPNEVYVQLETGKVYTRRSGKFANVFELVDSDPQSRIIPKALGGSPTGADAMAHAIQGALGQGS